MAERPPALRTSARVGSHETLELSVSSCSTHRRSEPCTRLEKRLVKVCSGLTEYRAVHDMLWLVSHLQKIPALQNVPERVLQRLARSMGAVFVCKGDDAAKICVDPTFSYFLVTGNIVPVATTESGPSLLVSNPDAGDDSRNKTDVRQTEKLQPEVTGAQHRCDKQGRALKGHTTACSQGVPPLAPPMYGAWVGSSCDEGMGPDHCAASDKDDPVEHGSSIESVAGRSLFSFYGASTKVSALSSASHAGVTCSLQPGHSLDCYLHASYRRGVETEAETGGAESPENATGEWIDNVSGPRWRLDAQEAACVGVLSHRFLHQLEREEPRLEVERKVAFLRRTEIFREGFSLPVIERLAVLMEHQANREASVVLQKGSTADKVVVVETGEAIRLGDCYADSKRNSSSLRVRTGQFFGGEEAVAGLPTYTSNLMATTALQYFVIPAVAFLEAIGGVSTEALHRLDTRARVASHNERISGRVTSSGERRPSTATGVNRKQSLRVPARECSSAPGTRSMPNLLPSETTQPSVTVKPVPFFSTVAARGYMRVAGTSTDTDADERINSMAAVWTPWSWSSRPLMDESVASARPDSAPASTTIRSAVPLCATRQLPPNGRESPLQFPAVQADKSNTSSEAWWFDDLDTSAEMGEARYAAVASPEFRSLGPSGARPTTLTGCEGTILSVGDYHGFQHRDISGTPPECLRTPRTRGPRRKQRNPSSGGLHRGSNRCTKPQGDLVVHEAIPLGGKPCEKGAASPGRNSTSRVLRTECPSLSTKSSCSSEACASIAATLLLWNQRELSRHISCLDHRPQRRLLCEAFRTRDSVPIGMTAAQRAYRGAYVMSKMGDARARSTWRPQETRASAGHSELCLQTPQGRCRRAGGAGRM